MRARDLRILAGGLLVGVSALATTTAAQAADIQCCDPPAPPPIAYEGGVSSGWYLRGDIGFSNQSATLDNVLYTGAVNLQHLQNDFTAAPFIGVGLGYRLSDWLRGDVTIEYRGASHFTGLDRTGTGVAPDPYITNLYRANKSEITGLVNIYADLGTWGGVTPFVGAGVGYTANTISGFTDLATIQTLPSGAPTTGLAYAADTTHNSFAWALMAGLGYEVHPGLTMELGYRYLNLGKAQSGDLITFTGGNTVNNPMHFNDLVSHDFKLGMRWELGGSAPIVAAPEPVPMMESPPLITK